jgi:hypothetical protein
LEEVLSFADWFLRRQLLWTPPSDRGYNGVVVSRGEYTRRVFNSLLFDGWGWSDDLVKLVKSLVPAGVLAVMINMASIGSALWSNPLSYSVASVYTPIFPLVWLAILTPRLVKLGVRLLKAGTLPIRVVGGFIYIQLGRKGFKRVRRSFTSSLLRRGWRRKWLCGSCNDEGMERVELGWGGAGIKMGVLGFW